MIVKEFRQLERDRRTLAMLIVLPVLLLVIFGYAARFDVSNIPTVVVGPQAEQVAARLGAPFRVVEVDPGADRSVAESRLQDGKAVVGVVTGGSPLLVLMDGTQLFSVRAAQTALGHMAQVAGAGGTAPAAAQAATVQILYNPNLSTSWIMIPGLTGLILVFIGTLVTSLGLVMIVVVGMLLFGVPFVGSVATFALGAVLFLMVTLGMGVLISTVSQNQGQAIQLAIMFLVPQVLLSGLIFPISSMAAGVRWIAYVLPLTYFVQISRGVMLKGTPINALWEPLVLLAALAVVVLGLAVLRFRRDLAPSDRRGRGADSEAESLQP